MVEPDGTFVCVEASSPPPPPLLAKVKARRDTRFGIVWPFIVQALDAPKGATSISCCLP